MARLGTFIWPPAAGRGPLREGSFLLLWSGNVVNLIGDQIFPVALVAITLRHATNPAAAISTVFAARFTALALFILIGGVLADRMDKMLMMIMLDVISAALVTIVVIKGTQTPLFALTAINFALGAVQGLFTPLYTATVPALVSDKQLQRANSLSNSVQNLGMVIGPGLAGLLVAGAGVRLSLLIDVVSFGISVLTLLIIRRSPRGAYQDSRNKEPLWRALVRGVQIVTRIRWLCALEVMAIIHTLVAVGPWYVLLPVIAVDRLGGIREYGTLLTVFGIGGLIGSLAGGRLKTRRNGLIALAGIGSFSLACIALGESVNLAFIAGMFALSGLGTQLFGVVKTTAIQRAVPSQVLGRVLSIDFFGSFAALPIGELLGGAITARTSPETVMKIGGLLVAITTCLPLLASGISSFSNPETPVRVTVPDTDEQSARTASGPTLGTADLNE